MGFLHTILSKSKTPSEINLSPSIKGCMMYPILTQYKMWHNRCISVTRKPHVINLFYWFKINNLINPG